METLILSGLEHTAYAEVTCRSFAGLCACLSAGLDVDSPGRQFKAMVNEDALLLLQEGPRVLVAICDGHRGPAAHLLVHELAKRCRAVPQRLSGISLLLFEPFGSPGEEGSGTTMVCACLDQNTGDVFGLSWGDSTVMTCGPAGPKLRNEWNDVFLHPTHPIPVELGRPFQFQLQPGEGLMLFTDGVNECCYRDPHRSVSFGDIQEAFAPDAVQWAKSVTNMALKGVRGNPGGEDNIALVSWVRGE